MKQVTIIAVFLLIPQTFASNMVQLNDSNFDNFIKRTSVSLVAFTTSWCGHSVQLQPELAQAADLLKMEDPTITLINVDCDEGNEICRKFGINGVPTIILFKNGKYDHKYTRGRTASEIVTYMKSKSQSSSNFM